MSEHLKKQKNVHQNYAKRILIRKLKKNIYQWKISCTGKNYFFCKNVLLYAIHNISRYWKSLLANFLVFWKWCPEILFLNLNLTVLLMNHKDVCRTALATPGLLITKVFVEKPRLKLGLLNKWISFDSILLFDQRNGPFYLSLISLE